MTTAHDTYFERLTTALRATGMEREEVSATVADLRAYVADSGDGTDPAAEFGDPAEFAARLTGQRPVEEPAAEAETWKWTTDIYNDRRLLGRYGDEGWEVERVDRLGRFVCRRDASAAQRWEYRREMANNARERAARTAELAPDAWEPCGHWLFYMYFKRPKAASSGPAAALSSVAEAPGTTRMFGSRMHRMLLVLGLAVMAAAVAFSLGYGSFVAERPWLWAVFAGAAVVGGLAGWYGSKRDVANGVEE
ncbi:hypothetical protein ACFYVL_15910 [Streptomyces sp. NPDC004111]|uniref:hypothetical protein n=1 Tax=Streptomyces sp. NPDC004111 TaxID=3364690 RepID=UPI0036893549